MRTHFRKLQFEKEGHKDTPEQVRIQRKLDKQKVHFLNHKALKNSPWGEFLFFFSLSVKNRCLYGFSLIN